MNIKHLRFLLFWHLCKPYGALGPCTLLTWCTQVFLHIFHLARLDNFTRFFTPKLVDTLKIPGFQLNPSVKSDQKFLLLQFSFFQCSQFLFLLESKLPAALLIFLSTSADFFFFLQLKNIRLEVEYFIEKKKLNL